MMRIVVDDRLRTFFQNFTRELDVCDESGRILARMYPVRDSKLDDTVNPDIIKEVKPGRRSE